MKFYGCKHVLLEEYDIIRLELVKREYIFGQFLLSYKASTKISRYLSYGLINLMYDMKQMEQHVMSPSLAGQDSIF